MNGMLLPLRKAARRFGVSLKWLKSEAIAGRVPVLMAEKRMLFNPEAVERSLANRAAESGVAHVR